MPYFQIITSPLGYRNHYLAKLLLTLTQISFHLGHTHALQSLYVSHTFHFPSISYNTAIYYIHAPSHFIEAHGFAMPGFQIMEAQVPRKIGDHIVVDFFYTTLFEGSLKHGRIFSERWDTSRVLLDDGKICGHVSVKNTNGKATVQAHKQLLRPQNIWEHIVCKPITAHKVENAIRRGYSDFKGHPNLNHYASMLLDLHKNQ